MRNLEEEARILAEHEATEKLRIPELSNNDLLDEAFSLAGGDDYDGAWTSAGHVSYMLLIRELDQRLIKIGFLEAEEEEQQDVDA